MMMGTIVAADELYQSAGEKSTPHRDPRDPARRCANRRKGHGPYANDRPPIISVIARETGEQRWWVCGRADRRTCSDLIAENIRADSAILSTAAWHSYRSSHPAHATVCHGAHEWARDNDGDGRCEVHCNTCEGADAAVRTYLRGFRGVHKQHLHLYVATYEAMVNTKRVTPEPIRRMCISYLSVHTGYT